MTQKEKELVACFLGKMECHVATHGNDTQDCVDHNNDEIWLYNKIAKIVGVKQIKFTSKLVED